VSVFRDAVIGMESDFVVLVVDLVVVRTAQEHAVVEVGGSAGRPGFSGVVGLAP